MAIKFNRSQTFATNGTVTASGLHNLVDGLDIYQAIITDQTVMSSVGTGDKLLIADADLTASDAPRAVTVGRLLDDALTAGTYTSAQFSNNLSYGTATGNRTVSTNATITTGTVTTLVSNNATLGTTTGTAATITSATIPTLTAGTTTSTAANITNGTVQTLTSSTLASNLTGGTYSGTLNSTTGTVSNLTSSTATISTGTVTRLTTTLAGDFTISQGTGTLGTSGVTAGTYGTSTLIPRITIDSKGRVTSATTDAITPAKILQIVSATYSVETDQSSNGYADTGLSASITPSSASNKILISILQPVRAITGTRPGGSINCVRTIGTTVSTIFDPGATVLIRTSGTELNTMYPLTLVDSPNTTSAITYKTQATRSGTATFTSQNGGVTSTIVLTEFTP